MEEKHQGQPGDVQEKKAANTLWTVMQYSGHYRKEYEECLTCISRFQQVEQMYACMLADVPAMKIKDVLTNPKLKEGEKERALEELWQQVFKKPVLPTQEQEKELKSVREYVQRLELEVTRMQADLSRIGTDRERARMDREDGVAEFLEEAPEQKEAAPKPARGRKKKDGGLPGVMRMGGPGSVRLDKIENKVKELVKTVEEQEKKIAYIEAEGSQVRGIVLSGPKEKGALSRRLGRKKMEAEKERIDRLLAEGYGVDQLDFLLKCREEGVAWEVIECFSGKEIPVGLMKKLKDYYLEKEKGGVPDSGTQEGAADGK